jgi:hypothetical protein
MKQELFIKSLVSAVKQSWEAGVALLDLHYMSIRIKKSFFHSLFPSSDDIVLSDFDFDTVIPAPGTLPKKFRSRLVGSLNQYFIDKELTREMLEKRVVYSLLITIVLYFCEGSVTFSMNYENPFETFSPANLGSCRGSLAAMFEKLKLPDLTDSNFELNTVVKVIENQKKFAEGLPTIEEVLSRLNE